jgi:hypothetical protein
MKTVTTVSNKQVPKSKTRKFKNGFYEIGVDCVKLNNRYWRVGVSVEYDHANKRYDFKRNLIQGYVGKNKIGWFKSNKNNVFKGFVKTTSEHIVQNLSKSKTVFLNKYVAIENNYKRIPNLDSDLYIEKKIPIQKYNFKLSPTMYNTADLSEFRLNTLSELFIRSLNNNPLIDKINNALKLSRYKFGIEYETSIGTIDKPTELGLIELRDGSLQSNSLPVRPVEYATTIIPGDNLISALKKQTRELKYNCGYNQFCSTHVHISGIPFSMIYGQKLYEQLVLIQDEFFTYFPISRMIPQTIGKEKNHCKKLPVENNAHKLFLDTRHYKDSNHLKKLMKEGLDFSLRKWNNEGRYYFVNMFGYYFKPNARTIEFRIHEGTFDFKAIFYYIILITAILEYVEKNPLTEKLSDIFESINPMFRKQVIEHFEQRRSLFFKINSDTEKLLNYLNYE